MSRVDVVWLIDTDPPSDFGGGRGFFPASDRTDGPDEALMRARFAAIRDVVMGEAGGDAVLTLHTSPRYRDDFFQEPYATIFRDFEAADVSIAVHPHEDRADGGSLYDDLPHLEAVLARSVARARAIGLSPGVFRSGTFAFHPQLPGVLHRLGLTLDLSAAPGLADPGRCIAWPEASWGAGFLADDAGGRVREIPLGWDGAGADLGVNYLYNERLDLAGLQRIWDAILRAAERGEAPRAVNFLTHGFGLVEEGWRRQAAAFLRHVRATGGRVVSVRDLEPAAARAAE